MKALNILLIAMIQIRIITFTSRHKLPHIILNGAAGYEISTVTYIDNKFNAVLDAYQNTIGAF